MIIGLIGGGVAGLPEGWRYPTLGQGKDTVADYLATKGFIRVAFADNLKRECAEAYQTTVARLEVRELKETDQDYLALKNCTNQEFVECALRYLGVVAQYGGFSAIPAEVLQTELDKPRSPRWATQLWGTQYRREMYADDYWVAQGCNAVSGPGDYTVTDVRMPNEPVAMKELGAVIVRIVFPGSEIPITGDEHPSEIALLHYPEDALLVNRKGDFEGLYRQLDELLELLTEPA